MLWRVCSSARGAWQSPVSVSQSSTHPGGIASTSVRGRTGGASANAANLAIAGISQVAGGSDGFSDPPATGFTTCYYFDGNPEVANGYKRCPL